MSRVVLVVPPWYRLMNWHFNEMPLGLCALAGYLNSRGHDACVLNQDLVPQAPSGEFDQKRQWGPTQAYWLTMEFLLCALATLQKQPN